MIEYVKSFMDEIGFDNEAKSSLSADITAIWSNDGARERFEKAIEEYESNIDQVFSELLKKAEGAGELVGVHKYSAELLLFVCLSKHLRDIYRQKGIDDGIWFDSMCDLKWKLWECQTVKGIHGSFVAHWFGGFFNMTRFALGRLQFEMIDFNEEYEKDGYVLTPKSKVINVHIPRTLTPFSKEACDDAFARAAEFFRSELDGAPVVFRCNSWLLSDIHYKILHEKSNVRRFMARFDIFKFSYNKEGEHPDAWRIFDMDYTGDTNDYPEDSFIRKAYKSHIMSGGITGRGIGVFFYD